MYKWDFYWSLYQTNMVCRQKAFLLHHNASFITVCCDKTEAPAIIIFHINVLIHLQLLKKCSTLMCNGKPQILMQVWEINKNQAEMLHHLLLHNEEPWLRLNNSSLA